jgi:hypothetical protein
MLLQSLPFQRWYQDSRLNFDADTILILQGSDQLWRRFNFCEEAQGFGKDERRDENSMNNKQTSAEINERTLAWNRETGSGKEKEREEGRAGGDKARIEKRGTEQK